MAALAKATPRKYDSDVGPKFNHLPVKTGVTVYAGGAYAIELATGKVYVPVGNDAVEVFIGWADETLTGDGSKRARFRSEAIIELAVTGVDGDDDIGKQVFATTDGDFSLTDSTADLVVGRVHRHVSGTTCQVYSAAGSLRGADMPA